MSTLAEKALKKWQQFQKTIKKTGKAPKNEVPVDQVNRMKALENDREAWMSYYFGGSKKYPSPKFHIESSDRIMANPEHFEIRSWARELAKSTRCFYETMYMVFVGHLLPDGSRRRKKAILLVSNSSENATRLLEPYKLALESNELLIHDYGKQQVLGSWEASEFTAAIGASFRALGEGESPRGTRNDDIRPDLIIIDDIDTDADCRNKDTINKRVGWIQEALIPTRSISEPLTIIMCGNIIAKNCCILRMAPFADKHDIVNIMDENGNSTWPEKNTKEAINKVLRTISYASAQKEYFNNPITEGTVFKGINYATMRSLNEYSFLVCYTDPSYKSGPKNDYKATVLVGMYKDEFHVIKAFCQQTTTADMIDWHYQIMDFVGPHVCYYYIEQVLLQDIFFDEFTKQGIARQRRVPIMGDIRAKGDKFQRIESTLEPLNRLGKLYFNEEEQANPHMKALAEQFMTFGPGSRAHDDGPDAVESAIWILNNKAATKASGNIQIFKRKSNQKRF